jgi:hypothetical protein
VDFHNSVIAGGIVQLDWAIGIANEIPEVDLGSQMRSPGLRAVDLEIVSGIKSDSSSPSPMVKRSS